jgi:DNA-binding beta-propeller fold protein YncE
MQSAISVGSGPISVTVVSNGSLAYVSCYLDDRVYIVDLTTASAVSYLPVGIRPNGICILPSGEYLYVANSSSGTVSIFEYSSL